MPTADIHSPKTSKKSSCREENSEPELDHYSFTFRPHRISRLLHMTRRGLEPKVVDHGAVSEKVLLCQILLTQFAPSRNRDWISVLFPTIIDSLDLRARRFAPLRARLSP